MCLVRIQFASGAAFGSSYRDFQCLALELHVLPSQFDPLFERADIHVIRGHVAQQSHQDVVVVLDRRIQAGVGSFDGAAEPAPEIEFPGQVEVEVPLAEKPL